MTEQELVVYRDKCNELNLQLAKLKHWDLDVKLIPGGEFLRDRIIGTPPGDRSILNFIDIPLYTEDWVACGELITSHKMDIDWGNNDFSETLFINQNFTTEVNCHLSAEAALRYSIVLNAIVHQQQITPILIKQHTIKMQEIADAAELRLQEKLKGK